MPGAGDDEQVGADGAGDEGLDRPVGHHPVGAGRDRQSRQPPGGEGLGREHPVHRLEGGGEPADRRRADGDLGMARRHLGAAGVADRVGGQAVAFERQGVDRGGAAARHPVAAETDGTQSEGEDTGDGARRPHGAEAEEGRGDHQAADVVAEARPVGEGDETAGRMGEHVPRLRRGRREEAQDGVEIEVVGRQIGDVALARVVGEALRAALAAPVEGRHGEAAGLEVADRLVPALDVFAASLQGDHRAARPGDVEGRPAQPDAVGGGEGADPGAGRNRQVRGVEQAVDGVHRRLLWGAAPEGGADPRPPKDVVC